MRRNLAVRTVSVCNACAIFLGEALGSWIRFIYAARPTSGSMGRSNDGSANMVLQFLVASRNSSASFTSLKLSGYSSRFFARRVLRFSDRDRIQCGSRRPRPMTELWWKSWSFGAEPGMFIIP